MIKVYNQVYTALLALILAAAAPRAMVCILHIARAEEDQQTYKKRLRHLLIFVAIAVSVKALIAVLQNYFS